MKNINKVHGTHANIELEQASRRFNEKKLLASRENVKDQKSINKMTNSDRRPQLIKPGFNEFYYSIPAYLRFAILAVIFSVIAYGLSNFIN